jgi:hypothetical protein
VNSLLYHGRSLGYDDTYLLNIDDPDAINTPMMSYSKMMRVHPGDLDAPARTQVSGRLIAIPTDGDN